MINMDLLTTKFKRIKKSNPKKIRSFVRNIALDMLSLKFELSDFRAELEKPRIQFLYIHHIFEDEAENFSKLLKELAKYHSFISYSEAVNKILNNEIDKPYIAFSSDDGFKNNLIAAKILNEFNIKACFFINPDTIGMKDFSQIKIFCKNRLLLPPIEFMDWDDVNRLLKNGHEIGSHTMGHINVAITNTSQVKENLIQSKDILDKRCGNIAHFAYPYGRFFHFHQEALNLVFETGYSSCASAERGCHIAPGRKLKTEELFIRRDLVIGDWNIKHVKYFILKNAINASVETNKNPYQK